MPAMRLFLCASLLVALAGCDTRPSETNCRKAIEKINEVYGLSPDPALIERDIRSCRAQWSKGSVECVLGKTTKEGIEECLPK